MEPSNPGGDVTVSRVLAILSLIVIFVLFVLGHVVLYTSTEGIGVHRYVFEIITSSLRGGLWAVLLISAGISIWWINFKNKEPT